MSSKNDDSEFSILRLSVEKRGKGEQGEKQAGHGGDITSSGDRLVHLEALVPTVTG